VIRRTATTVHQYLVGLWLIGVAVTVFLAGLGIFETTQTSKLGGNSGSTKITNADTLDPHRIAGSLLVLGTLLVLIAAGWARTSRRQLAMSAVFFVLGIVQLVLAGAGTSSGAAFGGLHVLNAFILTGLAVGLLVDDRRALGAAPAS
jgi:Family of unknown function (DUF6220)